MIPIITGFLSKINKKIIIAVIMVLIVAYTSIRENEQKYKVFVSVSRTRNEKLLTKFDKIEKK